MKIFAIQKTQTNTYSPQYQQNNSTNQSPVTKTNQTGDKFVSKVSFGASVKQLERELAKLDEKLKLRQLTEDAYEKLARPIREEIMELKASLHIEDDFSPEIDPDRHRWDT